MIFWVCKVSVSSYRLLCKIKHMMFYQSCMKQIPNTSMIFVSTVPPDIDHAPSAYQVVEGSGLILFCNATGNPKPNITWTKQGNSSELSTSETLTLSKLTREDDGSVFECTAQNYITSVKAMVALNVWCEYSEFLPVYSIQ